MRIFLGLGSNLGERELNLVEAKDRLMKHGVLVMGQSEVRETEPLGGFVQPKYLNQVIEIHTDLEAEQLLRVCKQVEQEMGRPVELPQTFNVQFGLGKDKPVEPEARWASRVIDLDILFYGDVKIATPLLTLPHPGVYERDFILEGLRDLDAANMILKSKS